MDQRLCVLGPQGTDRLALLGVRFLLCLPRYSTAASAAKYGPANGTSSGMALTNDRVANRASVDKHRVLSGDTRPELNQRCTILSQVGG